MTITLALFGRTKFQLHETLIRLTGSRADLRLYEILTCIFQTVNEFSVQSTLLTRANFHKHLFLKTRKLTCVIKVPRIENSL